MMMELVIFGGVALGLGAWGTVFLAKNIPEQLLVGGQDHGRYGYLSEDDDDAVVSNRIDVKTFRPLSADMRSRARHRVNPFRESRSRRELVRIGSTQWKTPRCAHTEHAACD